MTQPVQQQQSPYLQQIPPMNDFLTKEDIEVLKQDLLQGFAEPQQHSFIRTCQRLRLDPFAKQIFATRRGGALVMVVAETGLLLVADRTGNYDGCEISWCAYDGVWKDEWLAEEAPAAAKCVVYHKKRNHPEVFIARWDSFKQNSSFWSTMPDRMLAKCARAGALRGAFPDLSGLYISEELDNRLDEQAAETDEQKYAASRAREAADKAAHPEQYVTSGPAPEPAAVPTEAAFPEDKPEPPPPPRNVPVPELREDDDLDMGPSPPPFVDTTQPWMHHVILGIAAKKPGDKRPEFYKRKIGELDYLNEIKPHIEDRWLPAVRGAWDRANDAQKADAEAFEAAIAWHKMRLENPF